MLAYHLVINVHNCIIDVGINSTKSLVVVHVVIYTIALDVAHL